MQDTIHHSSRISSFSVHGSKSLWRPDSNHLSLPPQHNLGLVSVSWFGHTFYNRDTPVPPFPSLPFSFSFFWQKNESIYQSQNQSTTKVPGASWPFFLLHPLPHSLSHACSTSEQDIFLWQLTPRAFVELKNTTPNIPTEKNGGGVTTCCVTHGVYSGKRLNTVSVRSVKRV